MDLGIDGRHALVLGASRGLGAAIVSALAKEGVRVTAGARNVEAIRDVIAEMDPSSARLVTPVAVDLSDRENVAALIAGLGGVDILVNNGGGPKPGPADGQSWESWAAAFEIMARPVFALTDAVLPHMRAQGWGRIITIGSSGIVQPIPNLALSNVARSAVASWSKTLASETARDGITVNMVLPGRIDTPRVKALDEARSAATGKSLETVQAASRGEIPAGRYGRPEEFAAVVAFLASVPAAYVTGSMIRVDGGMIRGL